MQIEGVLGSVVVSAIISGLIGIYTTSRNNRLEYITKERGVWREEIRKCSEELYGASYQTTKKVCTRLKSRINAYGKRVSNRYSDDAHIWKIIGKIESEDLEMNDLPKLQSALQEYLTLLLKWDWERSKREVLGEKSKVIQYFLWIISVVMYTGVLLYENKFQNVDIANIIMDTMLVAATAILIVYVEKQIEETCLIMFVGHVVERQKRTSRRKYFVVSVVNILCALIASFGYLFIIFLSIEKIGITITNMIMAGIYMSIFLGAGAIFLHEFWMIGYIQRYYNYASAIDLIQEELEEKMLKLEAGKSEKKDWLN